MPSQTSSAAKSRAAQEARRRAAQRSAAQGARRSRPAPQAAVSASQPTQTASTLFDAPVSDSTAAQSSVAEERMDVICEIAETNPGALGSNANSVRQICRTRRQAVASKGRSAMGKQSSAPSGRRRPPKPAITIEVTTPSDTGSDAAVDENLDVVCEIVESNPSALGADTNSVRQLCRNRRKALSGKGKAAMPRKSKSGGRASAANSAMAYANVTGRELARLRRQEMASKGRGNEPTSRPSGRVRPAPKKVETGTTLSGNEVTGTQVERAAEVTGNESGSCRAITGTEYVGTEQFAAFCESKPAPNAPKVGFSATSAGMGVSGTEVGHSDKVTGDEQGTCSSVTGTEYLSAGDMAKFCQTKAPSAPRKVMVSHTERKNLPVTGADEARANGTTGTEAGAGSAVTGTQYSAADSSAKMTINGPEKVALTHTIAGQPVTGTEVGRSAKVTGDEHGSCRPVTGTEYLSNEQFSSVCQTVPQPSPAKVGVDQSARGQSITGNLVERSASVTGTEQGSCAHVTGSQYGQSKICGGAPEKAPTMHTLSGNALTGTGVDHSPKLSGGVRGGCMPVTGIEYFGQEQFTQYCGSTPPVAKPAKVGVEHTPHGQHVSGTMLSNTDNVTGNEMGNQLPVSGTPYGSVQVPENHGSCCSACAAKDAAVAAGLIAPEAAPSYAPAPQQMVQPAAVAPAPQQMAAPAPMQQVAAPAPTDFSIVSPARAAHITGNVGGNHAITGPSGMSGRLVSGTPEFRHPHLAQQQAMAMPQQVAAPEYVQMPAPVTAPTPEPVSLQQPLAEQIAPAAVPAPAQRITGEGRDGGIGITGDNWKRNGNITGTEGRSANRNASLRCEARGAAFNAHVNKSLETPEAPVSAVTGGSGNSHLGAVITVSGGARG